MLRRLEHRASPASWGAIGAAMASVVVGSALVTLGGTAAVIDGAALAGGQAGAGGPRPPGARPSRALPGVLGAGLGAARDHAGAGPGGRVPTRAAHARRGRRPSCGPGSAWGRSARAAVGSTRAPDRDGAGLEHLVGARSPTSSTASFGRADRRCRARASPPPRSRSTLPPDAVVALWLDPGCPLRARRRLGPRLGPVAGPPRRVWRPPG